MSTPSPLNKLAALIRANKALMNALMEAREAVAILRNGYDTTLAKLSATLKENKTLRERNAYLERQMAKIDAMLAKVPEVEAKELPKLPKLPKPRQRKAIAPPAVVVEEISEEELNKDIFAD